MSRSPHSIELVRRKLLALLGLALPLSNAPGDRAPDAALDADQWALLAAMARQHRLEPLLHDRLAVLGERAAVPEAYRRAWEEAYRASAMAALAAQGALTRLSRILDAAAIPYAALKGAWLAWHAYPHSALRPMRDIDILVAPGRLIEAYEVLRAAGFADAYGAGGTLDAGALAHKHLPALIDPATQVAIEVHGRLFDHCEAAAPGAYMASADALLANRIMVPLGTTQIAYLPPGDTLLHLVVHSVYEHRFDNGPQVLRDVAVLLASQPVDWRHFWQAAGEGGWTRGCHLLLRLCERAMGPQPIVWDETGPALPDDVLEAAALMLLQDTALRRDLAVQLQLGGLAEGTLANGKRLAARFLPERRAVADFAGIAPDNRHVWLHYPAWLATRLARTARGLFDRGQRREVARAGQIERWLGQTKPSGGEPGR